MGTIKKGILGGFSGKVGTVVGSSWKGIAYMRSLPLKVKNPRTLAQRTHRAKFAIALNFLKPMTELLRTGWKLYARRKSPFNAAMSYAFANAITGDYPDYAVDPSKILISRGSLYPATNPLAFPIPGAINLEWDDTGLSKFINQTDKALVAVVNPAKSQAVYDTDGAPRSELTQSINLPADWAGDTVEVYLGFISEDGKAVANSVYVGAITAA